MVDPTLIKRATDWFSDFYTEYDRIVANDSGVDKDRFEEYDKKFLLLFYDDLVVIRANSYLQTKIVPIANPKITLAPSHNKYSMANLANFLATDPKIKAKEVVFREKKFILSDGYKLYQGLSQEDLAKRGESEEFYYWLSAENQKKYLSSLTKVIIETTDKKPSEIKNISEFNDLLYALSSTKTNLPLWKTNKNILWSLYFIQDQIQLYLDLLCIGSYESASLPLRRVYECILYAIYFDLKQKTNHSVKYDIDDWLNNSDYAKTMNLPRVTGQDSIISNIINDTLISKFGSPSYTELRDIYGELSFRVHKDTTPPRVVYAFDDAEFSKHYVQFLKLRDVFLQLVVLPLPDLLPNTPLKDKEKFELFILENY